MSSNLTWNEFDAIRSDGLQATITAKMPSSSDDQVTTYTYGTAGGGAAGDSDVATGHLLQKAQYPDSSGGSDVVTFAYNAQAELIYKKDQAGNVIETVYDTLGRETDRKVTTLAAGFDGAVRRISMTYTSRGEVQLVTQYDAATGGNVVDEVKYTHEDWGLTEKFEQDRNSAVGAAGSVDDYEVAYTYAKAGTGGRNTIRRTGVTLPNGGVFTFAFSATGSLHDSDASRVTSIIEGETVLVVYDYNGVGELVGTTYNAPGVMWVRWSPSTAEIQPLTPHAPRRAAPRSLADPPDPSRRGGRAPRRLSRSARRRRASSAAGCWAICFLAFA